jgi:hypothetical protein
MSARKQQLNLLRFLQNGNVVVIKDGDEFEWFLHILRKHGLLELVPPWTLKNQTYQATVAGYRKDPKIGELHPGWDGETLYAECQIGKESIGIYPYYPKAVISWYGVEPMSVADLDDPGPGAVGSPIIPKGGQNNG